MQPNPPTEADLAANDESESESDVPTGKAEPLDDDQLLALAESEIERCDSFEQSELAEDRATALDYYYGRPMGNEEDGRSQVVSRDVLETIEWLMPSLLRVFAQNEYVTFEPTDEDDVKAAQQESDYTNHVFMQDNNGFLVLYDWFKDTLLSKYSVVTWGWEKYATVKQETYEGISRAELESLSMSDSVQITGAEARTETVPVPPEVLDQYQKAAEQFEQQAQMYEAALKQGALKAGPDGQPVMPPEPPQKPQPEQIEVYDAQIMVRDQKGCAKVYPIAPEWFFINKDARNIKEALICGHKTPVTKSDLLEMEFNPDQIEECVMDYEGGAVDSKERQKLARDPNRDNSVPSEMQNISQQQGWLFTCYLRVDADADGYNELRRLSICGGQLLENTIVDEANYAILNAIRMPHRLYGMSYADIVMDIQEIRSTLLRQGLDNIYLSNNPMKEVVEGKVRIDDLLTARVGGIVRVKERDSIREIITTPMTAQTLQMLEHVTEQREVRTGVTRNNQGLTADSLNKTARGIEIIMQQGQARIEMLARMFAETGVLEMFKGLHKTLLMHQDKPRKLQLRGEWVNIDPREWKERNNLTVKVGLGTGAADTNVQFLGQMLSFQNQAVASGMPVATPQNIYDTAEKLVKASGYRDISTFITKPEKVPQKPPQKSEAQIIAEATLQGEQIKAAQRDAQSVRESQIKARELELNAIQMQIDAGDKAAHQQIEKGRLNLDALAKGFEIGHQIKHPPEPKQPKVNK